MYNIIKKWAGENKEESILIGAIIIFLFVYSSFYFSISPLKFNSPDETANHFFSQLYAKDGVIRSFEPLNFVAQNRIHPRSAAVVNGYIVPGSFLGLILVYGWLAKLLGLKALLFLTPVFSGLAVFCFYEIINKIFNRQIAFWSSIFLLIHPAFWYYSSRGLFPNILFLSFIIFGFYFLIKDWNDNKEAQNYIKFILAGLFFGLAMTVRLSEITWVGGMLLALFFVYRKKINWKQVLLFVIFALITFSPVFSYNKIFYGNYFVTAYNLGEANLSGEGSGLINKLTSFSQYIFPFGIYLKNIFKNFFDYFIVMFWWLAIPLAFGVFVFFKKLAGKILDRGIRTYLLVWFFVSLFLFVYYGSWVIYDNPAKEVSIGTSYVRYWLPIYVLSLPLVSVGLIKFIDWWRGKWKKIIMTMCFLVFLFLSVILVFFDKNDGLAAVMKNVRDYNRVVGEVSRIIEDDAVIIVDRADKIFFPEYRVIQPLRDEGVYNMIPGLSKKFPLYYYGVTLPENDITYLYEKKIDPREVEIKKIRDFDAESLYKFIPVK